MAAARRLHPESWSYRRQTWELEEPGKAGGAEFWAAVDALGDRPYYPPAVLEPWAGARAQSASPGRPRQRLTSARRFFPASRRRSARAVGAVFTRRRGGTRAARNRSATRARASSRLRV